jgi:hypothetical protein
MIPSVLRSHSARGRQLYGSRHARCTGALGALALGLLLIGPLRGGDEAAGTFFGAHLQRPKVTTAPGADGAIDLICTVPVLGGCCFPLTSHDVTAVLAAPLGVTVLSGPEPASYPAIEAPVSGTPQAWATFRWRLKRDNPDAEATLAVVVASPDSGEVRATYRLGQVASCRVEGPALPEKPSPGQETALAVTAECLDEERFVKEVRFWYTTEIPPDATDVEAPDDLGPRGILRFSQAGRQLMVQAQAVALARKYEPTTWYGTLPALPQCPLYGVAVATDDTGNASCGPVVHCGPKAGPAAPPSAAAGEVAAAPTPVSGRSARPWVLAGVCLASTIVMALVRRREPAVLAGVAAAEALALVAVWFALAPPPATAPGEAPLASPESGGYPADGSVLVYLFLDGGEASRLLAERVEGYRQAAPHRIHVLCFMEGVTPAPLLSTLRKRYQVKQTPGVVFDAYLTVDASNPAAVDGTLDRCFNKPPPRLSMEMHGGVIAGRELSLGFIMCNHGSRRDVRGSTAMFAFENGVAVGGWQCDHVVREQVAESRPFAIPTGKCQPPAMLTWRIGAGVDPKRVGALTIVLDEDGHAIDSICTEKPCARTGVCG